MEKAKNRLITKLEKELKSQLLTIQRIALMMYMARAGCVKANASGCCNGAMMTMMSGAAAGPAAATEPFGLRNLSRLTAGTQPTSQDATAGYPVR